MAESADREAGGAAGRKRQFGINHLLILILLVAVGIVVWQKLSYVHPAHQNTFYEKAPYSRTGRVAFENCSIAIGSVTRSDRDGTVLTEDGFGLAQSTSPSNVEVLKTSGPWLDTAQIELVGGGTFDVVQARVFDFESRQLIHKSFPQSGQRMSGPKTLQIYRLGEKLPDQIDVWLRIDEYAKGNQPTIIEPKPGATCRLPEGTLVIREIYPGMQSYTPKTGVVCDPNYANSNVAMMLTFEGTWPRENRYQAIAVSKDGKRIYERSVFSFPGSYQFRTGAEKEKEPAELVRFPVGINDISHIEVRPFGKRHAFFFEGVKLPQTSTAKFQAPPVAAVKVGGEETTAYATEFEPLELKLTTTKGDAVVGVSVNEYFATVDMAATAAKNIDSKTTLVVSLEGLSKPQVLLTANPGPEQKNWTGAYGGISGGGKFLRSFVFPLVFDELESVQVQIK